MPIIWVGGTTLLTYKGRKHVPVYKKQIGKKKLSVLVSDLVSYTGSRPLFTLRIVAVRGKQLARDKKVAFKW